MILFSDIYSLSTPAPIQPVRKKPEVIFANKFEFGAKSRCTGTVAAASVPGNRRYYIEVRPADTPQP